jgi:uncharacterized protein YjbI with pentapeptide repeats
VRRHQLRPLQLKNANLAYARIEGASFRQADLEGADLLYTDENGVTRDLRLVSSSERSDGSPFGIT